MNKSINKHYTGTCKFYSDNKYSIPFDNMTEL